MGSSIFRKIQLHKYFWYICFLFMFSSFIFAYNTEWLASKKLHDIIALQKTIDVTSCDPHQRHTKITLRKNCKAPVTLRHFQMTLRYNYITLPTLRGGATTRCTVQIRPTVWHKYVLALVNNVLFSTKDILSFTATSNNACSSPFTHLVKIDAKAKFSLIIFACSSIIFSLSLGVNGSFVSQVREITPGPAQDEFG